MSLANLASSLSEMTILLSFATYSCCGLESETRWAVISLRYLCRNLTMSNCFRTDRSTFSTIRRYYVFFTQQEKWRRKLCVFSLASLERPSPPTTVKALATSYVFIVNVAAGRRMYSHICLRPSKRPPISPRSSSKLYVCRSYIVRSLDSSKFDP